MAKKHLALLIPHTDVMLESDFRAALPEEWVCHACRMYLEEVGEEAEKKMVDEGVPSTLKTLRGIVPFDGVVFGCTSASAVYGKEGLERLHRQMGQALDCPAQSAFGALKERILQKGGPDLALFTPYTAPVNRFFCRTLESFGLRVVFQVGLGLSSDPEIAACPPERSCLWPGKTGKRCRLPAPGWLCFPAPTSGPWRSAGSWKRSWKCRCSPATSAWRIG